MLFNKKNRKKSEKKLHIAQTEMQISMEVSTHFETPTNENQSDYLIEKSVNPSDSDKSHYLKEIHTKHIEILSNRPIPNLLEGASAILPFEDICKSEKPEMGMNLAQKKNLEKGRKIDDEYIEGHVA